MHVFCSVFSWNFIYFFSCGIYVCLQCSSDGRFELLKKLVSLSVTLASEGVLLCAAIWMKVSLADLAIGCVSSVNTVVMVSMLVLTVSMLYRGSVDAVVLVMSILYRQC